MKINTIKRLAKLALAPAAFVATACSSLPVETPSRAADIIPLPSEIIYTDGGYVLDRSIAISVESDGYRPAAEYLGEILKPLVRTARIVGEGRGADIEMRHDERLADGAYSLSVKDGGIVLTSGSYVGMISAAASLRQLMPADISDAGKTFVAAVEINDAPHFGWRGFMLDCSRHFWTKQEIKEILNVMSLYKLNKFHWHLTDDQGWRIEIKQYPELTEKGAWRNPLTHNNDIECVRRAEENDDADMLLPTDRMRETDGKTLYGGFYTQDDIREVLAYAAQRGIDVIPEIDMPGHSLQAIDNYPHLSCFGRPEWGEVFSTPLCPGKDTTLEFCRNVWSEILELFPYEYVNLGADEVEKHNWKKCPECQRRMAENGLVNENQLQSWFVKQMQESFTENGRKMIGWDEILDGGASSDATILWWRSWAKDVPARAAANGNAMIMCPNGWLYLDTQQSRITLDKSYSFEPLPASFTEEQASRILGVQGNLWCEFIPSIRRVHYQMFPRFFAVSELGWSAVKDTENFNRRVLTHYARLDALGMGCRVPDLEGIYDRNVFTDTAFVNISCPYPGATIRWTSDGTFPNAESPEYTGSLALTESTDILFRTFRPDGSTGDITRAPYIKVEFADPVQAPVTAEGLTADWYDHSGETCLDIIQCRYNGRYYVDTVSIPEGVSGNIGLVLNGFLDIPADGIYTFWINSDDGSMLYIDGELIIDNDGPHPPLEKTGQTALRAGLHPMEILYFDSNGGGLSMGLVDESGRRIGMDKSWFKRL